MDAVRDVVERAGGRIVAVADEPSAPLFPALAVRSSRDPPVQHLEGVRAPHLRRPSRPPEPSWAPRRVRASPARVVPSGTPRRARDRTSAPPPRTPRDARLARPRADPARAPSRQRRRARPSSAAPGEPPSLAPAPRSSPGTARIASRRRPARRPVPRRRRRVGRRRRAREKRRRCGDDRVTRGAGPAELGPFRASLLRREG